jgi:hypothetical protein
MPLVDANMRELAASGALACVWRVWRVCCVCWCQVVLAVSMHCHGFFQLLARIHPRNVLSANRS